jgi:hypothetical protein
MRHRAAHPARTRRPVKRWHLITVWTIFGFLAVAALGTLTPQYREARAAEAAHAAYVAECGEPTGHVRFCNGAPLDTSRVRDLRTEMAV